MLLKGVRPIGIAIGTGALALALAACSSSSGGGSASGSNTTGKVDWKTAQSAAAGGGMDALVAAAKAEGTLNVIAVPRDWAGYGAIIDAFTAKYGIKINSENPDGSSGDEINALKSTKGQSSAPDVVDIGNSLRAVRRAGGPDFAPYKVATWNDIPDCAEGLRRPLVSRLRRLHLDRLQRDEGRGTCPTTIKDLDNPAFKGKVALNGDPTSANAAFEAVWAAALANGGSADNIQPGIDFFKKLNSGRHLQQDEGHDRRRWPPARRRSFSTGTTCNSATWRR